VTRRVDFQALIPAGSNGLAVHLGRGISFGRGTSFFTATILKRRFSNYGARELKGEHVVTICGQPDASLPELLRDLATIFDAPDPIEVPT
jgi:hypothetical protein